VVIPDFGIVEGPFQITAIRICAARYEGEATYDLTLASAGALTLHGALMANPLDRRGRALTLDGSRRTS
jgi:hypothetical protein